MADEKRPPTLISEQDPRDQLIERLQAEIKELRQAVVTMCDTYSANRAEKLRVKAMRFIAAKGQAAFTMAAVEAELARLEGREGE